MIVRVARAEELGKINWAYTTWGYPSGAEPQDTVILAEHGGKIVGLVRGTLEHGVTMLRGMYVAPQAQRQGVGTALLSAFVRQLGEHDCYCVPYEHLVAFYGSHGFRVLQPEDAPDFLAERLHQYRRGGGRVLIMRRPASPHPTSLLRDTTIDSA